MDFFKKLTQNLQLQTIIENNWVDNKLIAVDCFFRFFGKEAMASISVERIDNSFPSYGYIESSSELHESFKDLLESEEIWQKIVAEVKAFIVEEWIPNNKDHEI